MSDESKTKASDPLQPSLSLPVKLASAVVHADEMLSVKGHHFDRIALEGLLNDKEVQQWLKEMGPFVPVKR